MREPGLDSRAERSATEPEAPPDRGAGAGRTIRRAGRRRLPARGEGHWWLWLREPRSAVLLVLALVLGVGGGRRLWRSVRVRRALDRVNQPDVPSEAIAELADYGRAGLFDLFRLLGTAENEPIRSAAGRALAVLWARDELIAEEEKALVRRGYQVHWNARRRYPRALREPVPIAVDYGIPFLEEGNGVGPSHLEWSHRVSGARRASLEAYSPWRAGAGRAEFSLIPVDFETNGPHRLVLQTRVRTVGLTEAWELELPHVPFTFELDPSLALDALLALPDAGRSEAFNRSVWLVPHAPEESDAAVYCDVNDGFAIRNPPALQVIPPLPCDLAHRVELEIEGESGRCPAGALIVCDRHSARGEPLSIAVAPQPPLTTAVIDRPRRYRLRACLRPDPELGWADPDVRSIWPEPIVTEWVEVDVVRR